MSNREFCERMTFIGWIGMLITILVMALLGT